MAEKQKNEVPTQSEENSKPAEFAGEAQGNAEKTDETALEPEAAPSESETEEPMTEEAQIADLEGQTKDLRDKLLRTAAELDNVRKRARRDVEDAKLNGRTEVLRDILPVMDSLDLALSAADSDSSTDAIIEGVGMVRKQFLNATERHKLKPIETKGQLFDPNFHEAVAQIESEEIEIGCIVDEVRKGYILGDRLLRASMVVVSKGTGSPSTDAVEPDDPTPSDETESDAEKAGEN